MIVITLYDNWLTEVNKKVRVNGKMVPRMSAKQIKELIKLCATAYKTEFTTNGTVYYIK